MTTIGSSSTTLEVEIHDVIMAMMADAKMLQQGKEEAKEETPSPRGVAAIDASFEGEDDAAVVDPQQEQRYAYMEYQAHTFLSEVMKLSLCLMEHSKRMTIVPEDVGLALDVFTKNYVDDIEAKVEVKVNNEEIDEDEDEDWESEEVEDENDDEELAVEEEIDEDDDDDDDEEVEREDETEFSKEANGFSRPPVSIGDISVKEFEEVLLWPYMHNLYCQVPMKKAAVEMFRDSLYFFLAQRFS
jgi:hypothetical protein